MNLFYDLFILSRPWPGINSSESSNRNRKMPPKHGDILITLPATPANDEPYPTCQFSSTLPAVSPDTDSSAAGDCGGNRQHSEVAVDVDSSQPFSISEEGGSHWWNYLMAIMYKVALKLSAVFLLLNSWIPSSSGVKRRDVAPKHICSRWVPKF